MFLIFSKCEARFQWPAGRVSFKGFLNSQAIETQICVCIHLHSTMALALFSPEIRQKMAKYPHYFFQSSQFYSCAYLAVIWVAEFPTFFVRTLTMSTDFMFCTHICPVFFCHIPNLELSVWRVAIKKKIIKGARSNLKFLNRFQVKGE